MLFLEHSEKSELGLRMKNRVASIALYEQGNEEPFCKEQSIDIFGKWEDDSRLRKAGELFALISSAGFICMAFYDFFSLYTILRSGASLPVHPALLVTFVVLFGALHLIAGIGGLFKYVGKDNFFSRFVGPYALVMSISIILAIIFSALSLGLPAVIATLSSFILNIFYVAAYLIDCHYAKEN